MNRTYRITNQNRNSKFWARVVGVNARRLRKARGWSQQQVTDAVVMHGCLYHSTQLSRLENWTPYSDGTLPGVPVDLLVALARVFQVSVGEMLSLVEVVDIQVRS